MTLEESSALVLAAAEAGDLAMLAEALGERREAMAKLADEAASEQLAARLSEAIEIGRRAGGALFVLKQRLGARSAQLARVAATFAVGCGVER